MGAGSDEVRTDGASLGLPPGALTDLLRRLAASPPVEHGAAWAERLRPGAVVGRFEMVRELGRGGFGVVWEARDQVLGRPVAFKAVVRAVGSERHRPREEQLLKEAEAAAQLQHPNLVTLHDAGQVEEGAYLVLELLRGETLAERLARGPLPVPLALQVAAEVASGLAHAHAMGVVHRDLKPANVFLCRDGQAKVLDFGLAHAFGHGRPQGGTPAYMAPEQAAGAPEDERTDVFALGVILFEMLAGAAPFPGGGGGRPRAPRPAPALDVPGIPGLGVLVGRMLERDPVQRPRDAGEVQEALRGLSREVGPAPAPAGPVRIQRRAVLGTRSAWLALAGLAAGLVGALLGFFLDRPSTPPEAAIPSVAVLPFADLSPGRDQEHLSDGIAEEIRDALAHLPGVRVIGRTSSFSYKGKGARLAEIGRALRVDAVLEGSVRREGRRVRISAQLLDVADESHRWSETYDREVADVFAIQQDVAREVARALRVELLAGQPGASPEPIDPEAFEQFLLGNRVAQAGRTLEDARRAEAAYAKAVERAPRFAAAWGRLAEVRFVIADVHATTLADHERTLDQAMADTEKAIALEPALAAGYVQRGWLRLLRWDWEGGRADVERALAISPGELAAIDTLAMAEFMLGRMPESIRWAQRAAELDPLSVKAWWRLGATALVAGRLDLARAAVARLLELGEMGEGDHLDYLHAQLLLAEGRPAEALEIAPTLRSGGFRGEVLTMAHHALGHPRESEEALAALIAEGATSSAFQIANAYAYRGERDRAFDWLERAFAQRDTGLSFVKVTFRSHRDDPRYASLLRKMNLPLD